MNKPIPSNDDTITIYDIAAMSGVSVSTVSRVINNGAHVSPRTKAKVDAVIRQTNYSPSSVARALNSIGTKTLGVIISDITNPYFSSLYLEIQRYAVECGYSILLFNTFYGGSSHGVSGSISETQYFSILLDKKVDGVLILGGEIDKDTISEEYLSGLKRLSGKVPVVILGEEIEGTGCSFISRHIGGGVSTLVSHLAALGRRKIAFVGGEPGVKITTIRLDIFRRTMQSLAIPVREDLIALTNYYTADGYEAMNRLLKDPETIPTAVIAMNDAVAIGVLRAMKDKGLRAPEDISVVSCDQFPIGEYYTPRITSLDRNDAYLGRFCIMTLLNLVNKQENVTITSPNPKLVIRESCGAGQSMTFSE